MKIYRATAALLALGFMASGCGGNGMSCDEEPQEVKMKCDAPGTHMEGNQCVADIVDPVRTR